LLAVSSPSNRSKHDGAPQRFERVQLQIVEGDTGEAAHDANKERRQSGLIAATGVADPR
jgi:hypothetical protein